MDLVNKKIFYDEAEEINFKAANIAKSSINDSDKSILVLAGDGIGPECVNEALKIIGWFHDKLKFIRLNLENFIG